MSDTSDFTSLLVRYIYAETVSDVESENSTYIGCGANHETEHVLVQLGQAIIELFGGKIGLAQKFPETVAAAKKAAVLGLETRRRAAKLARAADRLDHPWKYRAKITKATRRRIFERDGHRCVACGSQQALTVDHILAVRNGGGNQESNLQTLCRPCNGSKGTRPVAPIAQAIQ